MNQGRKPSSPYKGLNAFEDTELDALLFFGRERETEIVVCLAVTDSSLAGSDRGAALLNIKPPMPRLCRATAQSSSLI